MSKNKYLSLDILRCLALLGIIYIHTGMGANADIGGAESLLYWFNKCAVHTAVPMFFMVSGALLLKKEDSIKTLLLHRFLRFAIVLVVFQAFQYVYMFRDNLKAVYLEYFVQVLYSDQFVSHYWYLYSYLAYILMLPLLRKMVKGMEEKDYYYVFAVYFAFRCIYPVQYMLWGNTLQLNANFRVSFFLIQDAVIYPILGHYLQNVLDIKKLTKKRLFVLIGAAFALMLASVLVDRICAGRFEGSAFELYTFAIVPSAAIFAGMKKLCEKCEAKKWFASLVGTLSAASFATYLLHNVYMDWLLPVKTAAVPFVGEILACVLYAILTFIVGSAISFVIRLIPGIKKFI